MGEFWVDRPIASRDLLIGPPDGPVPKTDGIYTLLENDVTGYSPGFEVKDAAGVESLQGPVGADGDAEQLGSQARTECDSMSRARVALRATPDAAIAASAPRARPER
jgi:hypothetical protein